NQTLLDVAVRFKCERFVEECCHETLDRRFMGDIDPYDQVSINQTANPND
ncbi:hypothetical protein T484DRAFT_1846265, partial [Baffinella frigidus]